MEYTIKKFAELANLTSRTLRYYDRIGLLKPKKISDSGYRIYTSEQTDMLQQIMFYRSFGIELSRISELIHDPDFDSLSALKEHREILLGQKITIEKQLKLLARSIEAAEGKLTMTDAEKFEGLKKELIEKNEANYGKEIRERYGENTVEETYSKIRAMSEAEYEQIDVLGNKLIETLVEAFQSGDASCEKAQQAALMHKQWLSFYWSEYSAQAHEGIVQMYVCDDRFRAYYDKHQPGLTEFLRDAVLIFLKNKKERAD